MKLFGHDAAQAQLAATDDPKVTLITGPRSVGKATFAQAVLNKVSPLKADVLVVEKLSTATARDIVRTASIRPMGRVKVVLIDLDGATESAENVLLKTLEEPPPYLRFIITRSGLPLLTIVSRADLHLRLGYLDADAITQILISKFGIAPVTASRAAHLAGGTLMGAHAALQDSGAARSAVMNALNAVVAGDENLLEKILANWTWEEHAALKAWCTENITQRYRTWSISDCTNAQHFAPTIYKSLQTQARPKLAAASTLTALIHGR